MAPDWSSSAHSRRTVLKTAAGTFSVAAVGSLSGCLGLGENSDSSEESWPVSSRLDSVPDGIQMAQYVHVGDVMADPATSALFDAYFARQAQSEYYDGPTSLSEARQQFDEASPVSLDGLHEMISFNGNLMLGIGPATGGDEMRMGMVFWTDWEESALVDAFEKMLGNQSLTEETHQGQPMYAPAGDEGFFEFNLGVLGDGQYVVGAPASVENTIDVVAGDASPVGGTIRDSMAAARAGPMQFAYDVPQEQLEERLDERPDSTGSGGFGTAMMANVRRVFGSLYVDGDSRGVEVTVDTADSETASGVRAAIETGIDGATQSMESDDPFRGILADTSVDASGSTATLSYEASVSEVESLAADIENYQPPEPTPRHPTPEPALLEITDATGTDISADGIGALELTVALRDDVPDDAMVDLTETKLVLHALDHEDRDGYELDHASTSEEGDGGTFSTPGATTLETASATARLRVDLGEETPGYESDPVGEPIPAGSTVRVLVFTGSSPPLPGMIEVPETLDGETVALEVDNPRADSREESGSATETATDQ